MLIAYINLLRYVGVSLVIEKLLIWMLVILTCYIIHHMHAHTPTDVIYRLQYMCE